MANGVDQWRHDGPCASDESSKTVCEGMYLIKCNDVTELCTALRAVYALAGENAEVRKIVEDAIRKHGGQE